MYSLYPIPNYLRDTLEILSLHYFWHKQAKYAHMTRNAFRQRCRKPLLCMEPLWRPCGLGTVHASLGIMAYGWARKIFKKRVKLKCVPSVTTNQNPCVCGRDIYFKAHVVWNKSRVAIWNEKLMVDWTRSVRNRKTVLREEVKRSVTGWVPWGTVLETEFSMQDVY